MLIGVLGAAAVVAAFFLAFPLQRPASIDLFEVLRHVVFFIGVLAISLWARRDIPALTLGLALVLTSRWMELIELFTQEPRWLGTVVTSLLAVLGLVLIAWGLVQAARLRARADDERTRAEAALARSHATLRAVVEGSPDAVWVKDLGGAYLLANRAAAERLAVPLESLIGRRDTELLPTELAERYGASDREAVQGHNVRYEDTHTGDAGRRTFLVSKGLVRDDRGEPFGILGIARDISDRKAVEERLAHQATHDALTGLPNRAAFIDRLSRELSRSARQERHYVAALFIDLDNFKTVNDRLGHAAGDQLLMMLADRLGQWVRPGDSVARFGGDEFTVLLQEVEDVGRAVQVAERILEGLRTPIVTTHGPVNVTVSIGVSLSRRDGGSPEEMLQAADSAMYRAKAAGGNRHSVHVAPVFDGSETRAQA